MVRIQDIPLPHSPGQVKLPIRYVNIIYNAENIEGNSDDFSTLCP